MTTYDKEVGKTDQMISGPTLFQADLQYWIRRQIITSQERKPQPQKQSLVLQYLSKYDVLRM